MKVIGIYAGVGAGKSTVARIFAEFGAKHLDADAMVHAAYRDADVQSRVVARFGPQAFLPDGTVNRPYLADAIFADEMAKTDLEAILHPRVRDLISADMANAAAANLPAVVLDVPLLADSPLQALVTDGVFVDAPLSVREARCIRDRGYQPGEVARRDQMQPSLARKRELCRFVVTNDESTTLEILRQQIFMIWNQLVDSAAAYKPTATPADRQP